MHYEVKPTELAAVKGGVGLEQKVREEVAELMENGLATPLDLIFHSFDYEDAEFICYPRDGAMEVDTCYREDMPKPLDAGPFKGMSVTMPRGDSGNDPMDR